MPLKRRGSKYLTRKKCKGEVVMRCALPLLEGVYGSDNFPNALEDLDNDGLSNIFEYEHGLSINDTDTDHDGIDDGEELKYWNQTKNLSLSTAIEYCKNPDVDNDSIPDGKEIYGYEVKIIVGWKSIICITKILGDGAIRRAI